MWSIFEILNRWAQFCFDSNMILKVMQCISKCTYSCIDKRSLSLEEKVVATFSSLFLPKNWLISPLIWHWQPPPVRLTIDQVWVTEQLESCLQKHNLMFYNLLHTSVSKLNTNIKNTAKWNILVRGNVKKHTVYLQTLFKLRLTPLPPNLFLTNLFLTQCWSCWPPSLP